MRFWKTLIPDEPFVSDDDGDVPVRHRKVIPPAVKGWCVISILANGLIAGLATAVFRNVAPILLCAIFSLFPLRILFFWGDVVSIVDTTKSRAVERSPFPVINLSVQWIGISMCVGCTVMLCIVTIVLYSTYIAH